MSAPTDVIITWGFSSIKSAWLAGLTRPFTYVELPTPDGQKYGAQIGALGKHPLMTLLDQRGIDNPRRVMVCGFSQSCQGVLAFLRSDDAALIEHAILIDGFHCSWDNTNNGKPNADRSNVAPSCAGVVVGFADWASRGPVAVDGLPAARRYCTITHSSIVPTFPSTTDTAKVVLNKLFASGWPKTSVPAEVSSIAGFQNAYGQHGLVVAGWSGNDAPAHILQGQQVYQQVVKTMLVPRWNAQDPNVPGCGVQTTYGESYAPGACDPDAPLVVPSDPVDGRVPWEKYYDSPQGNLAKSSAALWVAGGIVAVAAGVFAGTLLMKRRSRNPVKRAFLGRERFKEKARGAAWFRSLWVSDKWELGDQFVLGTFDWRDWFDNKPSRLFLDGADEARIYWEIEQR